MARVRRAVGLALVAGMACQCVAEATRADASEDAFAAGYAAAVLERDFGLREPDVSVREGVLRVKVPYLRSREVEPMLTSLSAIGGITSVEITDGAGEVIASAPAAPTDRPGANGLGSLEIPGGVATSDLIGPRFPSIAPLEFLSASRRRPGRSRAGTARTRRFPPTSKIRIPSTASCASGIPSA
jgi:hypothetical protein